MILNFVIKSQTGKTTYITDNIYTEAAVRTNPWHICIKNIYMKMLEDDSRDEEIKFTTTNKMSANLCLSSISS